MTLPAGMTKSQKRRAYREAVQATLTELYRTPEQVSRKLVTAWWKRLSDSSAFKSDLFLHSEPINTAADLIHTEVIPITSEVRDAYHRILSESRDRASRPKEQMGISNGEIAITYVERPVSLRAAPSLRLRTTVAKREENAAPQKQLASSS